MSVDATRWAWKAPVKNATQRLILLSLADRAGEHHTCYPSNKRLAQDTMLNLKTVQKSVRELIELGLIADTGERKGSTNQVRVLQLLGVDSREYNEPKIGVVKQTQKRNSTKIGIEPKIGVCNEPKIGVVKQTQKRNSTKIGIEPKIGVCNEPKIGVVKQTQKRNSTKIGIEPKIGVCNEPKIGVCNEPKIGLGNLPIEPNNESNNIKEKFSFAGELKKLGANEQLISDWLQVRKAKKAGDTKTALNGFMKQVEKSGLPLNTVLEICVIRSWQGFNVDWLKNIDLSEFQPKQTTPAPQNLKTVKGAW